MHIGQLIKQELASQDRSVAWLANALSYGEGDVHKMLCKESIDAELLLSISGAMNVDFFKFYSEEFETLMKGQRI